MATEYQHTCPDCGTRFAGRTPAQATANWAQHFKNCIPERRPTFVFDLDGVIANIDHRLHYIKDGAADWDTFFSPLEMMKDTPIRPTIELIASLSVQYYVRILSARPERTRGVTMGWLNEHHVSYHALGLRPDYDHEIHTAAEWKQHQISHLMDECDIRGFFDDHPGNVKAVATLGIPSVLYDENATLRRRGSSH